MYSDFVTGWVVWSLNPRKGMKFFLHPYTFDTSVHNINTRHKLKLHKPATRPTLYYQRSVYYNSINIYKKLPDDLAELVSDKYFLLQLKKSD
jgi:hypothetical protein